MKKAALLLLLIAIPCFSEDIRIACIGNSITTAGGFDSYPVQMGYLFGEGYDVRNFGVNGKTMLKNGNDPYWNAEAFSNALEFEPDIVTIMLGTNDSKPQNWEPFQDEFEDDYKAMIDTFQALPSNPELYLCIPAKVFDNSYDILDSNVVKIKLIIEQIATELNLPLIDCYTFFENKPELYTDGVHPTYKGIWEYAKMIYLAITGEEGPATEVIQDINLAKGLPVAIDGIETFAPITEMTDRDYFTNFPIESGSFVELTLGTAASIDMVQILLSGYYTFNYQVETSVNHIDWTELGTEIDAELVSAVSFPFDSVDAQYVKITFNHEESDFKVAEISVLQTAQVHAPAITFVVYKVTALKLQYNVDIYRANQCALIRYCYQTDDGPFDGGTLYRADSTFQTKTSVTTDTRKAYFTMAYTNRIEVMSDTLDVYYNTNTSVRSRKTEIPSQFHLHQNYPNPFNPSTVIEYDLDRPAHVCLAVVDCTGRLVRELVNGHQAAGSYRARFDAAGLSSGLYCYVLESGGKKITRKMVLMH